MYSEAGSVSGNCKNFSRVSGLTAVVTIVSGSSSLTSILPKIPESMVAKKFAKKKREPNNVLCASRYFNGQKNEQMCDR